MNDKNTIQENELIIVFGLENVTNLPKAEVGSFFYKRKLDLYNVMAITSDKQGYYAIWSELTLARAGNNVASAFTAILKKIFADDNKTNFICWSDSSVLQNHNSHMPQVLLEFLKRTDSMKSVTSKYSIARAIKMEKNDLLEIL